MRLPLRTDDGELVEGELRFVPEPYNDEGHCSVYFVPDAIAKPQPEQLAGDPATATGTEHAP